jgi:hypothetical protein
MRRLLAVAALGTALAAAFGSVPAASACDPAYDPGCHPSPVHQVCDTYNRLRDAFADPPPRLPC